MSCPSGTALLCFLVLFVTKSTDSNEVSSQDLSSYFAQRNSILDEERSMYFGSKILLDETERRANEVLMRYKRQELRAGTQDPRSFLPSRNFLAVSGLIEQSRVYQVIRRMPKAGLLHAHLSASASRPFILHNITRRPNLYACHGPSTIVRMRFFAKLPESTGEDRCRWELLDALRRKDPTIDRRIAEALTMFEPDPRKTPRGARDAWKRFEGIFDFVKPLVTYRPAYEDFLYHLLEELYEDNVQFVEIRTSFSSLYELNGHEHDHLQVIGIYNRVVDRFKRDHPDFVGVKWIYSRRRKVELSAFQGYTRVFRSLRRAYPNHVVGFDLIGQEDIGRPLKDFLSELLALGTETQFFFHAGETNWNGLAIDENLVDAALLNTKRIGHGYALMKHPALMELIEMKRIAIEILPISNQMLKLVKDMRNHPACYLFTRDLPLVVSSDDPGFWGARALSFDFYETFVGIMSGRADLRALKQLALNSIEYSSFNDSEKLVALDIWSRRWRRFVLEIASGQDHQ
ncbi:adenosine deaminase 2-like [Copidosoma floridanum]|uniref:adenosine deaminase 2-like n=1 Tax=Copidosoma floridanum TaxID=29053 RepID=UPI0006C9E3E3|nr:adenosine deaminase 2-like [Copidosoma floridanum]